MKDTELKCSGCHEIKLKGEFYVSNTIKRGYDVYCINCRKGFKNDENRKRIHAITQKNWYYRNKEKTSCHSKVRFALKKGTLVKLNCFLCGESKTEAHHLSYDYPLKVVWLCIKHHKEAHKLLN